MDIYANEDFVYISCTACVIRVEKHINLKYAPIHLLNDIDFITGRVKRVNI